LKPVVDDLLEISKKTGIPFEISWRHDSADRFNLKTLKIEVAMVTAFVQFKIPAPMSQEQAKQVFPRRTVVVIATTF
jgi:hypothetical protein